MMSFIKKILSKLMFWKTPDYLELKPNMSYEYGEDIKLCLVTEQIDNKMLYVKNGTNIIAISLDNTTFDDFAKNTDLNPEILNVMTVEDLKELLVEYEELDLFEKCSLIQKAIDSRV